MTTKTDTSTVSNGAAASDPAASTSTASANGSGDLDAILKGFDDATSKSNATPNSNAAFVKVVSAINDQLKPIRNRFDAEDQAKAQQKFDTDFKAAVTKLSDGLPKASVEVFEGLLEREAGREPAFKKAWDERDENPAGWDASLAKFKEKATPIVSSLAQPQATIGNPRNDLDAAAASVRNVSTEPLKLEPFDSHAAVHNWSDREWSDYKRKVYAQQQAAQK